MKSQNAFKHGQIHTSTYRAWRAMLSRCNNPKDIGYRYYGARGIRVCPAWFTFTNFWADMGDKPPGLSLDRVDNDGPYEPGNCRWATRVEQNRNTRDARRITWQGATLHIHEWSERLGWPKNVIALRLHRGWPVDRIMTTPPRRHR